MAETVTVQRELQVQFCTYFDQNYLSRGVALIRSIVRHQSDATIWVLCLDDVTLRAMQLLQLSGVLPVPLADLERVDPSLAAARCNRNLIEYYFTCTPSWCAYVMDRSKPGDVIAYVDADLFFYRSPLESLAEISANSILVVPHRFAPGSAAAERVGEFNVGLVGVRNDAVGCGCLADWRAQCLESCSGTPENGRFADQQYLDGWPTRYAGVSISRNPGIGLAPWNLARFDVRPRGDQIEVDGQPLIFFHFHNLTILSRRVYDSGLLEYAKVARTVEDLVYSPYMAELRQAVDVLRDRGVKIRMRDWLVRRRRRSLAAILRKLSRARFAHAVDR